jgi:hypothetical protein
MLNPRLSFPRRAFVAGICSICLVASLAFAQTPSTAEKDSSSAQDTRQLSPQDVQASSLQKTAVQAAAGNTQDQDTAPVPSAGDIRTLDQPGVQELGGRGNSFTDNVNWLHWGPVGIRSAEILYTSASQGGGLASSTPAAATFQTNIAYNHRLSHSRLILQYSPRVLAVDGRISKELSNQDSAVDILFAPTSRWMIGVSDWFSFYGRENTLSDRTLERNNFTGSLTNPFLNNGQQTLTNSVAIPISYNTSARTVVSVSPFFSYARVSHSFDPAANAIADLAGTPGVLSTFQYGARTQLNHVFSRNQALGMFYSYQTVEEKDFTNSTLFQTFGATASRTVGRGLLLSGEMGGSRSANAATGTGWTAVGTVSLAKRFQRSSLQGTLGRDTSFAGLLGSGYTDYGWVNYSRQISRKMHAAAGLGYLSGPSAGQTARGEYVNSTVSYSLRQNLAWFCTFTHFWQRGNGAQLNTGSESQYQFGLRWSPTVRPAY